MKTPLHNFEHEAMATTFTIRIHEDRADYARQAAMEAFRECDRMEEHLSRFVESSSISRINNTAAGETVGINADAYLCLRQALHIAEVTGGAFDIGFRSREAGVEYRAPVRLSEEEISAAPLRDQPKLDLGGIGKGYAIDKMARLLEEWEVGPALISGGWSTVLAVGNPPGASGWSVNLHGGREQAFTLQAGRALSASGFSVQEEHVRDPNTGNKAERYERAWALAPSAAVSDALSTVFLVLPQEAIEAIIEAFPDLGAVLEVKSSELMRIGKVIPLDFEG